MGNEIKAWLTDILQAIQEINEFLPIERDFKNFKAISKPNVQLSATLK